MTYRTILPLALTVLAIAACDTPLSEDVGGDADSDPVTVALGDAGSAAIDAPVSIDVSVIENDGSYPQDAKSPLLEISGGLAAGETATIAISLDSGISATDEIVRAARSQSGSPQWVEVGTTTVDNDLLRIEVDDLNGVWAVVTAPQAPTVTSDAAAGTDRTPTWQWSYDPVPQAVRYRLDDGDWIQLDDPNTTSFTPDSALSMGEHSLSVQAGTGTGVWSEAGNYSREVRYQASDYFALDPGSRISYTITDQLEFQLEDGTTVNVNDGNAFVADLVTQNDLSDGSGAASGLIPLTPETDFSQGPESALRFNREIDSGKYWGFEGGAPSRGTGNYLWLLGILPTEVTEGARETGPLGRAFTWSYNGTVTMQDATGQDVTFDDTLRVDVTIDATAAQNFPSSDPLGADYWEGSGYAVFARGVGVVEISYDRANLGNISIEYRDHGTLSQTTISGTVKDENGNGLEGYHVELDQDVSTDDGLEGAVTNGSGEFNLSVYGNYAYLFVGDDSDSDGKLEKSDIAYTEQHVDTSGGSVTIVVP